MPNLARKLTRSEIAPILAVSFPRYAGRKYTLCAAESLTLCDLNWSGGTRNQYAAVRLSDVRGAGMEAINTPAPWANDWEGRRVDLAPGFVVVEWSIFCGKDLGIRVYAHPADVGRFLPAGGPAVPAPALPERTAAYVRHLTHTPGSDD